MLSLNGIMLLLVSLAVATLVNAQTNTTFDPGNCCSDVQEATVFAIVYGTPLVAYANLTYPVLEGLHAPNKLLSETELSTPATQSVVSPNVDTLYTFAAIDLSQSDLILTVPLIDDGRYWVFPFYDPYGNQFAQLSSDNGAPAGDYLIRRADDAMASPGLEITQPSPSCIPRYKGIVNFPTTYGLLLNRILLGQNDAAQLAAVTGYQKQIALNATARTLSNPSLPQAPQLTAALLNTTSISNQAEKALALLARIGQYNQPIVAEDRYRVGQILGQAGVSAYGYSTPAGGNLADASSVALAAGDGYLRNAFNLLAETNDWVLQKPSTQGNFGTSYLARYAVALSAYLELNATEALYPSWAPALQSTGEFVNSTNSYLITFAGGRPPLANTGFWSLTAYDGAHFLIPNALDRYEVGDRSNITYADNTPVYPAAALGSGGFNASAPQSNSSASRPFEILLQAADVTPPSNWTANWLPGPSGGGQVYFTLRWYAPGPAYTNGTYEYPIVQQIAPIRA